MLQAGAQSSQQVDVAAEKIDLWVGVGQRVGRSSGVVKLIVARDSKLVFLFIDNGDSAVAFCYASGDLVSIDNRG